MAEIIKSIEVDVAKKNTFKAIVAKQGDKITRFLKVQLLNEGEKIVVGSSALVSINAERSDTLSKAFKGEVNEDGTVTVPLTYWMLELDGQTNCSISIYENDGKLTSCSFAVLVEHAEVLDDDISGDDSYDLLLSLINTVQNGEAERAIAENQRESNETARKSAEIAREAKVGELVEESTNATQDAKNAAQQVASALLAGGMIPIYNEDENKNYTFQLIIRNGYPVLSMIEAE